PRTSDIRHWRRWLRDRTCEPPGSFRSAPAINEHAGNVLGATIGHAMWQDALSNAQVISTDATGALIQPAKTKDGRAQACKKGHFFTAVADCDAILFAYTEEHTSAFVQRCSATSAATCRRTRATCTTYSSTVRRRTTSTASGS